MMRRRIVIAVLISCLLIFASAGLAKNDKNDDIYTRSMKKHAEEMRIKYPQKYQEMMQRSGGNPTECLDCHDETRKK